MTQPQRTQTFSLGKHWNEFIDNKIKEGRYASGSEVVRESLRLLEEKEANQRKLEALRQAVIEGENSGNAGKLDMEEIRLEAMREEGLID
ncbi:type II toxin-antitoxin system ParD family antitoxin [Rickettsiales bacterium LUAb2]